MYSSKPDYEASEDNPRIEDGSFDITEENSKERNEEGTFDTTDENSKERSTHGSFDRVDESETTSKKADSDDDNSLWESVKDFFIPDTYDYEMESQMKMKQMRRVMIQKNLLMSRPQRQTKLTS